MQSCWAKRGYIISNVKQGILLSRRKEPYTYEPIKIAVDETFVFATNNKQKIKMRNWWKSILMQIGIKNKPKLPKVLDKRKRSPKPEHRQHND